MSKIVENYKLYEILGEGSFGKVYRGLHMKTDQQFAIKQVRNSIFEDNPKFKEFMLNEIKTLSQINSENVVRFIELLKSANNAYFVYEYCNGGTLDSLIKKNGRFSEQEALQIFHQIVSGFKELVKLNVLHRDLKPQNIFLNNKIVKLGDFGFCKQLQAKEELARTMLGSPIYMAPEILNGFEYTMKADIWSLGVVLYEMLYGICPYNARTIMQLTRQIELTEIRYPPQIQFSAMTKQLLERMLVKKEKQRISWEELFELEKQIYTVAPQQPIINQPTTQNQSPQQQQQQQQNQQQNQAYVVHYRKEPTNSPQIQQSPQTQQITSQQQVIINQQMKFQNPQLIPMKRGSSSQKEPEEEQKSSPIKSTPSLPQKLPAKQNTLLWFYPIQNQSFTTKCEFYNFLLGERNKIVFLIKILFKCHSENKAPLQSSLGTLVQLFCAKMNSELLEYSNIQQKNNVEFNFTGNADSYFSSYEYKKIQETTQQEIKEFFEQCLQQEQQNYLTYDIISIIKEIIQYLQNSLENLKSLKNDEQLQKKQFIFLNSLIDCLLVDELFLNFIDLANANLEEQEYFKQIENCELPLLEQIVQHKIAYGKAKFFKN